jgi:hypothetical protein
MAAQYGPHRWSAGHDDDGHNAELRGARLEVKDLRDVRLVDCDLRGAKVIDSMLVDVDVTGFVNNFVVNGVDVTEFVESELDRRHPERVQLREISGSDDFRAMWETVERLWSDTMVRARRLPEDELHRRVDGEWSFVETLRHLVFITDSWASRTIRDEPNPFHRLALPQTAYSPADAAALGMEIDSDPSFAEVLEARDERLAMVRGLVGDLTDDQLGRACPRSPAPGYPDGDRPVWECLAVVMEEECQHHAYAVRDLDVLESIPWPRP